MSSVTPEGTVNAESTMVAQSFLLAEALKYPSSPENVQDSRLCRLRPTSTREGAGVGLGAGEARTPDTSREIVREEVYMIYRKRIIGNKNLATGTDDGLWGAKRFGPDRKTINSKPSITVKPISEDK